MQSFKEHLFTTKGGTEMRLKESSESLSLFFIMLNSQIREGCWWNETLMPQLTSFSAMLPSKLPRLWLLPLHHLSELLLGVWRRPCIFDKAVIKQRHHVCVHFLSFSSTDSQTVEREHVLETSSVNSVYHPSYPHTVRYLLKVLLFVSRS